MIRFSTDGYSTNNLDFDGDALKLALGAYRLSRDYCEPFLDQYQRDYDMYRAFVSQDEIAPDRAFVFIPKLMNIVDMKSATNSSLLFGNRPYIPFESKRYPMIAEVQSEVLDELLARAGMWLHGSVAEKMKTLYGISYMECLPDFEECIEKVPVPIMQGEQIVGYQPKEQKVQRFCLKLRAYAPWDIYPDPAAVGLESPEACRYVVKIRFVSLRSMEKLAAAGRKYTDVDFEKLRSSMDMSSVSSEHTGRQIMSDFGLNDSMLDQDMHVLMIYESPERFIEVLDGVHLLVDVPNPFKHGMINLSRMIHNIDPNTLGQMFSIGEGKPNEIMGRLLNDMWSDTVNVFNIQKQPVIFHRENIDPNILIWTQGNRIPIPESGRPIEQDVKVEQGTPLPPDHFSMLATIERYMDLTSKSFAPQRGEVGQGAASATEIAITKSVGDKTQEQVLKMAELVFMRDFGKKALSIIEQFMPQQDVVEMVGPERAAFWFGGNPAVIPGGYSFKFHASDMATNQTVRQNAIREALPIIAQFLQAGQLSIAKETMEAFDFKPDVIQSILQEAASLMMMHMQIQAQQQQAQLEAQMAGKEQKGQDNKEKKNEKGTDGRLASAGK